VPQATLDFICHSREIRFVASHVWAPLGHSPFPHFLCGCLVCSFRLSVINWWHVFLSYVPMALTAAVVLLAIQLAPLLSSVDVTAVKSQTVSALSHSVSMWPLVGTILMLLYLFIHFRSRPVYLLDFACFDPPESWQITHEGDFAHALWLFL
jgi:hypothetical protein